MQLKKWGILVLCVLTIVPFAGCTPKEEEPAQIETEEPKEETAQIEQPKKKLSREIKYNDPEKRSYFNDELLELYPELKEIKTYLFKIYADALVSEKAKPGDGKPPIEFGYTGGGRSTPAISIVVNFKENVTKEQMIEACNYIMGELRNLFPLEKETYLKSETFIAYTSDEIPKNESLLGIRARFYYQRPQEIEWTIHEPPSNDWVAFDPNVPEQPAPEEPPAEEPQTAVASEIPMSKVSGVLSEVGFEITHSMEATDGYVLAGEDAEGFSEYLIALDKDKNVKSMTCTISEIGQPLTGNDFLVKAMTYMGVCVTIPYEEEETSKKALRFVLDNMDMGLLTLSAEEEKTTIGGWDISLSYIEKSKTYMLDYHKVE